MCAQIARLEIQVRHVPLVLGLNCVDMYDRMGQLECKLLLRIESHISDTG